MCHWLGVLCWKTLSDRNFWFICVHIKRKKKKAILARIVSLRSFIVLILFLDVLGLSGDWKSCAAGRRLPLPLPDLLCQVAAAAPAQLWEVGLGRGSCQLGQVPEQQVGEAVHRNCSRGEMQNSVRPQGLASPLYLIIYFLLSAGELNVQISHKDARDGHAWVNGAALPADCKLSPKPWSWKHPVSWVITDGHPCWDLIGYNASWKLCGCWKSNFVYEWPLST